MISAIHEDPVGATLHKWANDFGPNPRKTLLDYCRVCGDVMDGTCFSALVVDVKILEMYDQNYFQHNIAIGARKRRGTILRKWCPEIMIVARFA